MCPNCKTLLPPVAPLQLADLPSECPHCSAKFAKRDGYIDLTAEETTSSTPIDAILAQLVPQNLKQNIFRLQTLPGLYERGWRDMFQLAGFPGAQKEIDMFLDFAQPHPDANVLDLSCGSGILTRPLVKSGQFAHVVAADYSDAMARQTVAHARRDVSLAQFDVVRANVLSLPFGDGAFDVVHASAALHCYPKLPDALAEIYRVTKAGGKFFATTFFKGAYTSGDGAQKIVGAFVRPGSEAFFRFFDLDELEWLLKAARFDAQIERIQGCAVIRAVKNG